MRGTIAIRKAGRFALLGNRSVRLLWWMPFIVPIIVAMCAWWLIAPTFLSGQIIAGDRRIEALMPLVFHERGEFTVDLSFHLHALHPDVFYIVGEDCLTILEINGQPWPDRTPVCGVIQGKSVNLGPAIRTGNNAIRASMKNGGGIAAFYLRPSLFDPLVMMTFVAVILSVWWAWLVAAHFRGKKPTDAALTLILITVCALRVAYVMHTPYFFRNHDTDGHVDYITYVAQHLDLPPAKQGWESWQPPLYYVLSAAWYGLGTSWDFSQADALFLVQLQSLALTIGVMFSVYMIAHMAWSDHRNRRELLLGIGTLPGLLYLTGRVNNDVLACALSFFAFAFLLAWWKKGTWTWWYAAMIAVALAVLTKYNGLLMLPVAFLTLLLRTALPWKTRALHMAAGFLIVAAMLTVSMFRSQANSAAEHLVGNIESMNGPLKLPVDAPTLVTFNPIEILRHPYNNPWSDEERRANFPEYFFRSAFAGEWGLGDALKLPLQVILLLALLLLPVAILGIIHGIRQWRLTAPFLSALFVIGAGHAAFRVVSPFSPSQDFRYSPLLAVPFLYFFLRGSSLLPPAAKRLALAIFHASIVLWVLFVFSL